jgi:hypothetical protein
MGGPFSSERIEYVKPRHALMPGGNSGCASVETALILIAPNVKRNITFGEGATAGVRCAAVASWTPRTCAKP